MYKFILLCLVSSLFSVHATTVLNHADIKKEKRQYEANQKTKEEIRQDLFMREQWKLNKKEWQRYQELMKGVRGSISPATLSPIEVLGTHARNNAERDKYAKLWAQMIFEDAGRVLAFQKAYNLAFHDLYGHIALIDVNQLNLKKNQINAIHDQDRVLVFIRESSCSKCDAMVRELLLITQSLDVQVDLFFVDTKSKQEDEKLRHWASTHIADKERLRSGKITLNHDNGSLFKLTKSPVIEVPVLFKSNQQETIQIYL